MINDSFIRWVEGKASEEETLYWEAWLKEDPARIRLKEEAIQVHQSFRFKEGKQDDLELEFSKLNTSVDEFEKAKKTFSAGESGSKRLQRPFYSLVAAVGLLLIVVLGSLYFLNQPTESTHTQSPFSLTKSTEFGEKKLLTLTDGSTVRLNANSSLKFTDSQTRDLKLWLQGEAYFDIVRKTGADERTITVHTPDGKVQVLGTEFNVNTFKEGTEVVLKEGSVKVGLLGKDGAVTLSKTMKPRELSQFTAHGADIHIKQINPELYTSWTDSKLIFDHTPMSEIAERIKNIYGVEFIMTDPKLSKIEISGSIPNDNLPMLLRALEKIIQKPVTNKNGKIQVGLSQK